MTVIISACISTLILLLDLSFSRDNGCPVSALFLKHSLGQKNLMDMVEVEQIRSQDSVMPIPLFKKTGTKHSISLETSSIGR